MALEAAARDDQETAALMREAVDFARRVVMAFDWDGFISVLKEAEVARQDFRFTEAAVAELRCGSEQLDRLCREALRQEMERRFPFSAVEADCSLSRDRVSRTWIFSIELRRAEEPSWAGGSQSASFSGQLSSASTFTLGGGGGNFAGDPVWYGRGAGGGGGNATGFSVFGNRANPTATASPSEDWGSPSLSPSSSVGPDDEDTDPEPDYSPSVVVPPRRPTPRPRPTPKPWRAPEDDAPLPGNGRKRKIRL